MNRVLIILTSALFLCTTATTGAIMAWLGIAPGAAPAYERQFDLMLRESFNVAPSIVMLDESTIRAIENRIGSHDFTPDSRTLVQRINEFVSDSTIFVKGYILGYEVRPARRFIRAHIQGEMTVKFTIYSLRSRRYLFSGDIHCSTTIPAGWIFFGSADRLIHIGSSDREKVVQRLLREAVDRSTETVLATLTAEDYRITMTDGPAITPDVSEPQIDPFRDLFGLPSAEGAVVEDTQITVDAPPPAQEPQMEQGEPMREPDAPPPEDADATAPLPTNATGEETP